MTNRLCTRLNKIEKIDLKNTHTLIIIRDVSFEEETINLTVQNVVGYKFELFISYYVYDICRALRIAVSPRSRIADVDASTVNRTVCGTETWGKIDTKIHIQ